jgi:hypothetical protein
MSEHQPIVSTRRRSDRWSGRKTLLFIIIVSAILWMVIALIVRLAL